MMGKLLHGYKVMPLAMPPNISWALDEHAQILYINSNQLIIPNS
jgi:hypothetical protein